MYWLTLYMVRAAGWVRYSCTALGKRPVSVQRIARMLMEMRMPQETSLAFSHSLGSCPKNTDWVTFTKEARVRVEVTSATMVTKAKPMLPVSTAFS